MMETSAWEAHKGEIEHLYLRENKTLDALRQIMRTKHGFSKTKNQYQVKLNRWGFRKYRAGPEKWKYIKHRLEVRQQQNRILSQRGGKYHSGYESQDCEVYIDGVLYSSATVKCEIRRQAFESTYRRFAIGPSSQPPEGVIVCSPSPVAWEFRWSRNLPWFRFFSEHVDEDKSSILRVKSSSKLQVKDIFDFLGSLLPWKETQILKNVRSNSRTAALLSIIVPDYYDGYNLALSKSVCSTTAIDNEEFTRLFLFLLSNNISPFDSCRETGEKSSYGDELTMGIFRASNLNDFRSLAALVSMDNVTASSICERLFGSALRSQDTESLLLLLEAGINPNMAVAVFHNYYETMLVTPLEFAVCVEDRYLSTIITRVLLSHGADPNFCGQGKCPLTDVAFAGATTVDDFFLEADTGIGQRINGNSLRNATILGIAVAEGNLEAARLLVLEGADTNAYEQTKLYGHACQITALGLAAGRGDIPIMNLLLDAGARVNPDTSSENCGPPLVVAVYSSTFGAMHLEEKRAEVVRLLLDSGAGIHADSSPFLACHENLRKCLMTRLLSFNDLDSFRLLLDAGCEASSDQMEEFNSASLLRYVEQKEDSFVYQRLIFDARRKEDAGGRALKSAIELGHHGIMYFLQKAGVTSLTRHPVDFIPTIKVARFLEEKRVLKEILAISGQRILVAAILYTKDLVSFLLENGADKSPDDDYLTTRSSKVLCMHPLEAALCQSDWKLSGDLIDRGAQIGEPEITAMVWSLLNNKVEPHSWFWSMLPSHRISAPTAIGMALKAKNYSLVYSLLNNGVDPRGTPVVFNYTKWKSVFGPIILDDQNHSDMAGWWNFKLISKDGPSSVLEMAEASGDSSIIRALLESGRWAEYARNPRIHALELGIKKTSVANTQVVVSGASSLQRAIQSGSIETVRAALETDREAVAAVLDDAVSTENFDAMNILIQAGLDLKKHTSESAQLQQKSTILQKAVITGNLALVKMLLAAGANINGRGVTGYGMDALRLAVEQGNIEILGFLLEQGAEVNQQVGHLAGPTALHIAASAGYIGIVRRLIDHGADINDSRGVTALEGAAKYGHIDILQLLFNEGAEIKGAGLVPYTRAIKLAEERGFYSAARLLRSFLD